MNDDVLVLDPTIYTEILLALQERYKEYRPQHVRSRHTSYGISREYVVLYADVNWPSSYIDISIRDNAFEIIIASNYVVSARYTLELNNPNSIHELDKTIRTALI